MRKISKAVGKVFLKKVLFVCLIFISLSWVIAETPKSVTFMDSGQNLGSSDSHRVAIGDLDGDGDLDAFVVNWDEQPSKVWLNNGSANFTDSGQSLGSSYSNGIALGDLDGDGDLDAFVVNHKGKPNKVWLNVSSIEITSPKEEEVYNIGDLITVQWTAAGISGNVEITLHRTDEPGTYVIKENHPCDKSPVTYTIPADVPTGTYFVKVLQGDVIGNSGNFSIRTRISPQEREALIALYNSTKGDEWKNNSGWKDGELEDDGFAKIGSENSWYGITCDEKNEMVLAITLNNNNLTGTIPSELGNLSNLKYLYLEGNQLTGDIPAELWNLSNLIYLHLYANKLTGSIPAPPGNLPNLERLYLQENQLTGSIPAELGNLVNLRILLLYSNQLSGVIPPELGNLSNLFQLSLNNNELSGDIPPELNKLSELSSLSLNNNMLSGTIPAGIGNLAKLEYLALNNNQIPGNIPSGLGHLSNLEELNLANNLLTGSIPAELGNLGNLSYISLNGNMLSGPIPTNLTNLTGITMNSNMTNIGFNALYADDDTLKQFLNSKDPDWEITQTVAPTNLKAEALTETSIKLSWTPIQYTADSGGYRVFYSTSSGGPYTLFNTTADKLASRMEVTGLSPGTKYFFVIQTRTNPHSNNQNTIDSEYSREVFVDLTEPFITVLTPKRNDVYNVRNVIPIKWKSFGITGNVQVTLRRTDEPEEILIKESYPYDDDSSLEYTVANDVLRGVYQVEISQGDLIGKSGKFYIAGESSVIRVTSPGRDLSFARGATIDIAWTTQMIKGDVKITLCNSDGKGDYVIKDSHPYNESPLSYTIPDEVEPGTYFIKIEYRKVVGKSAEFDITAPL